MLISGHQQATLFIEKLRNPNKFKLLLKEDEEIPLVDEQVDSSKVLYIPLTDNILQRFKRIGELK